MELNINGQSFNFNNDEDSVTAILMKINQEVTDSDYVLSHLMIDGVEIYEHFRDYLLEHITSIQVIEAIFTPLKNLVHNLLLSNEEYLQRAIPELKQLIGHFYQGPTNENWLKFNELLEGLQWIQQLINIVDNGPYQPSNWNKYLVCFTKVQDEFNNLEDALKVNDHILIADILQYEIFPELKRLKNELGMTIDQEGKRYNVN